MRRPLALVAVLVLVGCNGGTVDRHALTNDAATVDSINCEAWLLSKAVARDRVTVYYAREQAEELAIESSNLADALRRRPTATGIEQRVRAKGHDAGRLATRLWRLHDHPNDANVARELADRFQQAGNCS